MPVPSVLVVAFPKLFNRTLNHEICLEGVFSAVVLLALGGGSHIFAELFSHKHRSTQPCLNRLPFVTITVKVQ